MSVASFEDFKGYCAAQDVTLPSELSDLALKQMDPLNHIYSPSTITGAITAAGKLIREGEVDHLATRALKIDRRVLRTGSAALVLAKIINGTLEPDYDSGEAVFDSTSTRQIDACRSAEYRFTRTILGIEENDNPNCQIIGNGQPVLLRKARPYGIPSSLTLQDISINGVPYPAGSIVRLDLFSDGPYIKGAENGIESIGLDDVKNVGFIRLSAFSLSGYDRLSFHEAKTDTSGHKPLRPLTTEEIVEAAQSVYTPSHS